MRQYRLVQQQCNGTQTQQGKLVELLIEIMVQLELQQQRQQQQQREEETEQQSSSTPPHSEEEEEGQ